MQGGWQNLHDYVAPMPTRFERRHLIVRLRNWVGDVVLGVPTLQRLANEGWALDIVGKGWSRALLDGQGWPVHALPRTLRERVGLLRRLRTDALARGLLRGDPIDALCLPDSMSSALEFRLAGLRALGHANEGRSLLLGQALRREPGVHELQAYWRLGDALLGSQAPLPAEIRLQVSARHLAQADEVRRRHGIEPACILICPFAGGTWAKQDKTWPGFAEFAARVLPRLGRDIAVCPGPGEEEQARRDYPGAVVLPDVDLGTYAGLLQGAALMVANDTGPGHIAAAVGTPLVSVLGPSDPVRWRPWGPGAVVVQGIGGTWPTSQAVGEAVDTAFLSGR
jgi:heptosyltransferase-2